jgi:ribosomal protein L7/L12
MGFMMCDMSMNLIREKIKNGLSVNDAIVHLHQQTTIIQSIKFIVEEYNMSLAEAKELVSNHPIWKDVVLASEPIKEDIINSINKLG